MIHFDDPPRLLESESTPRELREWLVSAKQWNSSGAEVASLVRAVEHMAAAAPGLEYLNTPQPLALQGSAASATAASTKLIATLVVGLSAAAVGVGGWASQHDETPQATFSRSHATPAQHQTRHALAVPSQVGNASGSSTRLEERGSTRSRSLVRISPGEHSGRAPARGATHLGSKSNANASPAALAKTTEAEEWRVLRAAREAISSDPERALALVREHARRFPEGMLGQERETIAIDALARQGRADEVRARAQKFRNEYPASPYRSHITATVSRSASTNKNP